jgi:hypothetical protein
MYWYFSVSKLGNFRNLNKFDKVDVDDVLDVVVVVVDVVEATVGVSFYETISPFESVISTMYGLVFYALNVKLSVSLVQLVVN